MPKHAQNQDRVEAAQLPSLRWSWNFGIDLGNDDTLRLLALLSALLETPALAKAAGTVCMSYRAAWGLLRYSQQRFGVDLVVMERGRGTHLTPFGKSLLEMDAAARTALSGVHAIWETRMRALLEPTLLGAASTPTRLRLYASHDLALADWVEHGRRVPVDIVWQGGEAALAALARGECDLAGFHVPEAWSDEQLACWLGLWLKPGLHVCLPIMRRQQGLIVPRGNPLRLNCLADVAAHGARMVNRQRGSGTRALIDQLLTADGVDPVNLNGYSHEEFTHDAVAATVAGGSADAGFGIMAAASRYDLDFIPLVREHYYFALRHAIWGGEAMQILMRRLAGHTFRQRLAALPGYELLDNFWTQSRGPLFACIAK